MQAAAHAISEGSATDYFNRTKLGSSCYFRIHIIG